jgi:hypothetical protein
LENSGVGLHKFHCIINGQGIIHKISECNINTL